MTKIEGHQMTFGDICANKHKGNQHSRKAFQSMKGKVRGIRERVLEYLETKGNDGATSEEIAEALEIRLHSMSARCSELKAQGLIVEDGERTGESGRPAAILKLRGRDV